MKKTDGSNFGLDKSVFEFANFQGMDYGYEDEPFELYKTFKNSISKERIIAHIEKLEPLCLMPMINHEIFTKERFENSPGYFKDGDFVFPTDFLHYLKNYDIGIPYEYEEYLKQVIC